MIWEKGRIQEKYAGTEYIKIGKLKPKLDYWKGRWNAWKWVGEQSGVGRDLITGRWTASDETWEIIFKKKPSYQWIKTQDPEYRNRLKKLFTSRSANGKYAESITTRQNEVELSNDEEELSPRAGSATFPETPISADSESDANSAPHKGLDQDKTPRFMGFVWIKPFSLGQKRKATQDNKQPKSTEKSAQNLAQQRLENMKPEARVIEDIKKNYKEGVEELSLEQFTAMLQKLKAEKEEYGGFTG